MSDLIDSSTRQYAFAILLKHTREIKAGADGVKSAEDIEAIHKMRVATRRLRTAFVIFSDLISGKKLRRWNTDIKFLTQYLGPARDLDVQIEELKKYKEQSTDGRVLPGINRLIIKLNQKRKKMQTGVIKALDKTLAKGALDDMEAMFQNELNLTSLPLSEQIAEETTALESNSQNLLPSEISGSMDAPFYSPALYYRSAALSLKKMEDLLEQEIYIYDPANIKELHEMRIKAKWLRYSLEFFAPLYEDKLKKPIGIVKIAQDYLGQIHDNDVWISILPDFIKKESKLSKQYFLSEKPFEMLQVGLEAFYQSRFQQRQELYSAFLEQWLEWKKQGAWDGLRLTITQPLQTTIFPQN